MTDTQTVDDLSGALSKYPECQNLHSSLQRISFDIDQMIHTFVALQQCAPSPSNTGYTAYIESCLLHIRSLIKFFADPPNLGEIAVRNFAAGDHSLNVIQALDFTPVRDVIDRYLVAGNRMTMVDSSSRTHEILRSAVVTLAETFESFLEMLSPDLGRESVWKMLRKRLLVS